MKKIFLSTALFLGAFGASFALDAPQLWDFSNGGEGFTCYDQDKAEPSVTAQKYGFAADGDSWLFGTLEKEYVAISNSAHKKVSATAEDWLITPAVTLGEGNTLTFDAYTVSFNNAQRVATVDVKLSTTGCAVEDFTIDLMSGEQITSGNYGVDLSEYAGQTVYVAIINKSRGKDLLVVDNIFVGVLPIATVKAQYTRLQAKANVGQRIAVELTAGFGDAVTSIDATLTCGDFSTNYAESGLTIEAGADYVFQFDETLPAPTAGEGQYFEVEVLVNGTETITTSGEIITQAYQPAKRVVCEEQTGTWCGWCPRGHVYMEMMDEKFPDSYIGIAAHSGDIMQYYDYTEYLSPYMNGAPSGRVQRDNSTAGCDPMDFPTLYTTHINTPALADITISAEWTDDTKSEILLGTEMTFALNARNLETRLEYIIVEDDVHQPDNSLYDQTNYFAGNSHGQMGGYEGKTDPVPAAEMYYDDVVRYVIADKVGEGIAGSVPNQIEKGVTYKHWAKTTVPANVFHIENCEFIVLLLDFQTGVILNAAKCNTIKDASSVENLEQDATTRAYAANGGVRVEVNTDALVEVNVYAADGRLVYAAAPRRVEGSSMIDCRVAGRGVYLVNVVCDGVAKTHKVVL